MTELPGVPISQKMSADELNRYLFRLVEALSINIRGLEERIKKLEEKQ